MSVFSHIRARTVPALASFGPIFHTRLLTSDTLKRKLSPNLTSKPLSNLTVALNNRIRAHDNSNWRELLVFAQTETSNFDGDNYATTLLKLNKLPKSDLDEMRRDELYQGLVADMCKMIKSSPLNEFGRGASTISIVVYMLTQQNGSSGALPSHLLHNIVDQVAFSASWFVPTAEPRDISNMAWAVEKLGMRAPALFREIEKHSKYIVKESSPRAIADLAHAVGRLQFDAPTLMDAIDEESKRLIESGTHLGTFALSFANLGHKPVEFFNCLEKRADEFVKSAHEHHIASIINVSWSIVTLGLAGENEALLQALWKRAMAHDVLAFTNMHLNMLVQVDVHARASGCILTPPPPALRLRMIHAAKLSKSAASAGEDEFSSLLTNMGFKHERELQFLEGDYGDFMAIDFASKERKIAIEFDGTQHYLTELRKGARIGEGRANGKTAAKRRLMEQMGWKVVNIDYKDNNALDATPRCPNELVRVGGWGEYKKRYLRERLKEVGLLPSLARTGLWDANNSKGYYVNMNKNISERDGDWRELLEFAEDWGRTFNEINFATTLTKLSRFEGRDLSEMHKDERYRDLIQNVPLVITSSRLRAFGDGALYAARVMLALAKLNEPRAFTDMVNEQAKYLVETGEPLEIANLARSFATMGVEAPALFEEIEIQALSIMTEVPQTKKRCSNVAKAAQLFADAGYVPAEFFDCLEKGREKFLKRADLRSLCEVCRSIAILGLSGKNEALLQALWKQAMETNVKRFRTEDLELLLCVAAHARGGGVQLRSVPEDLEKRMAYAGKGCGVRLVREEREWGGNREEYFNLLMEMGFEGERGVVFYEGMAMGFGCRANKIAVEVGGGGGLVGPRKATRRLLEHMGWKVLGVGEDDIKMLDNAPREKVEKAGGGRELKVAYLRSLLKKVGVML